MTEIKSAAVLGSGVMGSGIAAHLANAGIPVLLLDMTKDAAKSALETLKKSNPAAFMHKSKADLITVGSFDDDLSKIADVDWVIEAVLEDLDIKKSLYAKVEQFRGVGTIISSNTSTIPLSQLTEGRNADFKSHFLVTHFFNPPRYMRLLEVVKSVDTQPDVLETITDFADRRLGKGVVSCHDTPGFIANRIGTYWIQTAITEAFNQDMTVEEVDKLFSKPLGIPKTGVFGMVDLVGLDLIPLVSKSMRDSLAPSDVYVQEYRDFDLVTKMIADGYTGRKGKGGFYRLNKEDGKKVKEAINLKTGEYAPATKKPNLECLSVSKQGLSKMLDFGDRGGNYTWSVLSKILCYTADLAFEIADDIHSVDQALKLGYNWKYGPFELLDKMGVQWFAKKLTQEGRPVPALISQVGNGTFYRVEDGKKQFFTKEGTYQDITRRPGVLLLRDIKLSSKPILKNGSASLWDVGDGVCCFEFTSVQNTLDNDTMDLLSKSIDLVEKDYKALVIHNEGENFSLGANLGLALFIANLGMWDQFDEMVKLGQAIYQKMKYANIPVVTATSGMVLGGGCEGALHSDAIQAHAETYIGLVEVGVGIVPAWGGCKEMLLRWSADNKGFGGPMSTVAKVFELVGTAQVAKSAYEAKDFKIVRENDGITMNKDRLLADAKEKALELAQNYTPPEKKELSLPGKTALIALDIAVKGFVKAGKASPYDEVIAKELGKILSGGGHKSPHSEDTILSLEYDAIMKLFKNSKTLARIESIVLTNKPLRN